MSARRHVFALAALQRTKALGSPSSAPSARSGGVFFLFVLVEFFEEAGDVGFLDVVGGGEAEFAGVGAADADFVGVPEPVFEVEAEDGGDVYGDDGAAEGRVGRGPRCCTAFLHFG